MTESARLAPMSLRLTGCHLVDCVEPGTYRIQRDTDLVIRDGRIEWIGAAGGSASYGATPDGIPQYDELVDCGGAWVTPGLVDCHSHIIYGGSRVTEFEQRLNGVSYADISKQGGGILSTVGATRDSTLAGLLESARDRLTQMAAWGSTTVEIKSGYGLDLESERKMLRVARQLDGFKGVSIKTTLLAAHTVAPEFREEPDRYVDEIVDVILPELAMEGLVDAVDVFCEGIAFSVAQARRVYEAAQKQGLRVKGHVDQLSNLGGSALIAEFGGLSADHLEYSGPQDIRALAEAGVVAVLLPGAFYFLSEEQMPPIELIRQEKMMVALATDANPGTSPVYALPIVMNMASVLFGMTPAETLGAVTLGGARALGLRDRGLLDRGMRADLCVWNVDHPAEIGYYVGFNPLAMKLSSGELIKC